MLCPSLCPAMATEASLAYSLNKLALRLLFIMAGIVYILIGVKVLYQ